MAETAAAVPKSPCSADQCGTPALFDPQVEQGRVVPTTRAIQPATEFGWVSVRRKKIVTLMEVLTQGIVIDGDACKEEVVSDFRYDGRPPRPVAIVVYG